VIRRLVKPTPAIAKINVTPIIDVALVLVIILLITAPMLAVANLDIDLPEARTRALEPELRLNITLGRDGEVAIDEDVVAPEGFGAELRARIEAREGEDVLVVLRADATVPHRAVRELLQEARNAGVQRVAVATRPRSGGRP
jgi:biopolymer transport protein ExbD